MITAFLMALLTTVVGAAMDMLPEMSFTFPPDSAISGIQDVFGALDVFLPMYDFRMAMGVIVICLPIWMGYRIFSWIWNHIPTIAGFGVGGKS